MNSEISSILRLNGWAGKLVLGFYGLGTTVVAVLNLGGMIEPALGIIALGLMWTGLIMLGVPQGEPLGLRWTLGVIGVTTVTTAISCWNIADPANPGYATWPLGAMTILLFVLALRGRRGFAWIGFAALAAVSIALAVVFGLNVVGVVTDVLRQSATLLIGTLFAIILRRATQTITSIQRDQVARASMAAATEAAARDSAAQSARLEREAKPALDRIVSEAPLSSFDLEQFARLEAALRDGAPATGLGSSRITEAARQARLRGLSINFIDDRGAELSTAEHLRVESTLLQLMAEQTEGTLTARLNPVGSADIATIVVDEGGRYRRVLVTPHSIDVAHI